VTGNDFKVWHKLPPFVYQDSLFECYLCKYYEGKGYRGQLALTNREGRGTYLTKEHLYEGYWKNNKMNGQGRLILSDSSVFEGNFKNNTLTEYSEDGNTWKGSWEEDKSNGTGRLTRLSSLIDGKWV